MFAQSFRKLAPIIVAVLVSCACQSTDAHGRDVERSPTGQVQVVPRIRDRDAQGELDKLRKQREADQNLLKEQAKKLMSEILRARRWAFSPRQGDTVPAELLNLNKQTFAKRLELLRFFAESDEFRLEQDMARVARLDIERDLMLAQSIRLDLDIADDDESHRLLSQFRDAEEMAKQFQPLRATLLGLENTLPRGKK